MNDRSEPVGVGPSTERAPLSGLRVVDFSNGVPGVQAGQLLADFGAQVVWVEPPGGSPLRHEPAWPFWGRGRQSVVLDLRQAEDRASAQDLAVRADIVLETFRPGVADRLGIGYDELAGRNPGVVYASISGFGSEGPLAGLQGYEGIVLARLGALWAVGEMVERPGPAFTSARFCTFPATQLALQGVLAALLDRESSGRGQHVETTLAQGLTVHDTYNWFARVAARRYPDAFQQAPLSAKGVPSSGMSFRLLIALTRDGRWVQFSQTAPRLFQAMMRAFDLAWMLSDPKWRDAPDFDDVDQRVEFWERLLNVVRAKTVEEWMAVFDEHPDVWAETFRHGHEVLDHPQMAWNGMVVELDDPERGMVRQPGPLVKLREAPPLTPAPALPRPGHPPAVPAGPVASPTATPLGPDPTAGTPPLAGVTVVELGTYYAAPFGATLLADLGATVVKVEQLDGDPMRNMIGFPEVAGIKALLGKMSLAVDIHREQGQAIVHDLVRRADVVLQSFRAGVAERLGLDAAAVRRINPDLVYLSAPGYGLDGPYGHRPAYAPTIGAAAGLAWRNAGASIPEGPDLDLGAIKPAAMRLATAVMGVGNADGFASVAVGTALLLGLVARKRTGRAPEMLTTMLSTATHALSEDMVSYEGRRGTATADPGLHGLGALYRLYEASDGWVFLAAPSTREWERLVSVPAFGHLGRDERFADHAGRSGHDGELAAALAAAFRQGPAVEWERDLRARDVACVVATQGPVDAHFVDEGSVGRACGFVTDTTHPLLDVVPRLAPLVRFSRSSTMAGPAGLTGDSTDTVLRSLGYQDGRIAELRAAGIVGG